MELWQFLACRLLWLVLPWTVVPQPAQNVPPQVWENTAAKVEKGTRVTAPKAVLQAIVAKSKDCPEAAQESAEMFEAYRFETKRVSLIAVKDGGRCGCSPTGNCSFGIYRRFGGRFALIMSSSMVLNFGFLKHTSNGLPDVVTWSHGSAFMSGVRLWQFNGKRYAKRCSWDAVFHEGSDEAQIENNTCQAPTEKQSVPTEKH